MRLWNYLKMQLKKEIEKKEIVGYKFIYGNNFLFVCKDCATSREKKFAKTKNIITKSYSKGFLRCDRCGTVI